MRQPRSPPRPPGGLLWRKRLRVRGDANGSALAFVVHDGDIWAGGTAVFSFAPMRA